MLILTRHTNEKIIIKCESHIIQIIPLAISKNQVKFGILADKDIIVDREEIYEKRLGNDNPILDNL